MEHFALICPALGGFMKLVSAVKKKFTREKSLKAYAWYIWY